MNSVSYFRVDCGVYNVRRNKVADDQGHRRAPSILGKPELQGSRQSHQVLPGNRNSCEKCGCNDWNCDDAGMEHRVSDVGPHTIEVCGWYQILVHFARADEDCELKKKRITKLKKISYKPFLLLVWKRCWLLCWEHWQIRLQPDVRSWKWPQQACTRVPPPSTNIEKHWKIFRF